MIPEKLTKDQKVEVMHVAICSVLSPYGYYEFMGKDEEGWPHWKRKERIPPLQPDEQDLFIKKAILEYIEPGSNLSV